MHSQPGWPNSKGRGEIEKERWEMRGGRGGKKRRGQNWAEQQWERLSQRRHCSVRRQKNLGWYRKDWEKDKGKLQWSPIPCLWLPDNSDSYLMQCPLVILAKLSSNARSESLGLPPRHHRKPYVDGVMVRDFNPSTWETGRQIRVQGQPTVVYWSDWYSVGSRTIMTVKQRNLSQ